MKMRLFFYSIQLKIKEYETISLNIIDRSILLQEYTQKKKTINPN